MKDLRKAEKGGLHLKKKKRNMKTKKTVKQTTPNRTYKARLFEMVFSEKQELLELYNAMNGTDYKNPELLQINTLENAIYMSMHNDLSFIIDSRLNLYEHQSTYSPNLPLRCLMYVSDLYSEIVDSENLYGKKRIEIPSPRFVVFYNGAEERPDKELLALSNLFSVKDEEISLELKAIMLNINPGHNAGLLNACKVLRDYSEYTYRVRFYAKEMRLEDAVERAITECINDNILKDFLRKYRAEAKKVSIYEYDEERHMRQTREEGFEEGQEIGIRILIETYLEMGMNKDEILTKVSKKFGVSEKVVLQCMAQDEVEIKKVSIYEYDEERHMRQTREAGFEEGVAQEQENGIRILIESCRELGAEKNIALHKIVMKYAVSEEAAEKYLEQYWK